VLAALTRRCGDFATAEDAVQEALIAAAWQWPQQGVPDNPVGWLYQVASRRMVDFVRSEHARRRRENDAIDERLQQSHVAPPDEANEQADDTVLLLFMCCHPSLSPTSAIALTLRAVAGLTTAQIARAFLVPEATMAQRISRAKQTIKKSGATFAWPSNADRAERLSSVLDVLYLLFNEGYLSTDGDDVHCVELSNEAMRVTRDLHRLLPDDAEVAGLLALMWLTDARRPARTGPHGELIPLDEQDRRLWNQTLIKDGTALIVSTIGKGQVGTYQLQAAIASLHDEASDIDHTDWPQITALYDVMMRMSDNPMIALNHAVATAMVHGPAIGLAMLEPIASDPRLSGSHRLDAVRAHLLALEGDAEAAVRHYRAAAGATPSFRERNYLLAKASKLASSAS
jgi:RNA polymerase sigma factor (sigma-70 family)